MKEPIEMTDRDRETLRKVESLLASPHSAPAEADDVSVLLANTVPQADDAFRRQLDAQLMEKLESKQERTSQQNVHSPSPTAAPPVALTQPASVHGRLFNRVTGGLGSMLVAATLVAALALAAIYLWQSQRNMPPADNKGTPVSILDPQSAQDCGKGWTVIRNPVPGVEGPRLRAVAVVSPNDIWAAGDINYSKNIVALHWDGVRWETISIPGRGHLRALAAVASDDVWAVGDVGNYTFHWDGIRWNSIPFPTPDEASGVSKRSIMLYGLAAISANDVWAVGAQILSRHTAQQLILHWNGNQWSIVEGPPLSENQGVSAIAAVSANDVWAVGEGSAGPLITHWDGNQWSIVPSPDALLGSYLSSIAVVSSNDVWAVGTRYHGQASSSSLIMHWDGKQWSVVPSPDVPRDKYSSDLFSVAVVSANDVWAVGHFLDLDANSTKVSGELVMRWNGRIWETIPTPDLVQAEAELYGVTTSPSGGVWAVGAGLRAGSRLMEPLVLRYGKLPCPTKTPTLVVSSKTPSTVAPPGLECGPRWTVSSSPDFIAGDNNLKAVAAISPNDVWAVGQTAWAGALAMQWDGNQWSVIPTPDKVRALRAVAGVASNDVWAVGDGDALHWDGRKWNVVPMPTPEGSEGHSLYGIEAIAANDVWAVGYHAKYGAGSLPLIEHWDGTQWRVIPNPAPNIEWAVAMQLRAVSAVSRDDVWAVGDYFDGGSTSGLLIMHWNGKQWSLSQTPQELNGSLLGVAAVSANDVWAVGVASNKAPDSESGPTRALIMHWDGKEWSVMPEPDIPGEKYLSGVAAVSANNVWAVGTSHNVENGGGITLHWDGNRWSAPDEDKLATFLAGVAALPSGEVWAAGGGVSEAGRGGPIVLRYGDAPCVTRVPTRAPTAIPIVPTSTTPTINVPVPSATSGAISRTPDTAANPTSVVDCTPGWKVVDSPNPSTQSNELNAVAIISANDIWAVGTASDRALTLHWDGKQWSVVPAPGLRFDAIAAVATDDVWALGLGGVAHWDGKRWEEVSMPIPGDSNSRAVLVGIAAISANDIWAVGYYQADDKGEFTLTLHWDGKEWSVVPSPNITPKEGPPMNSLLSVSAVSTNDIWAVGASSDSPLALHWNGKEWSVVPVPRTADNDYLSSVVATASNDVWAGGTSETRNETGTGPRKARKVRSFIIHWDGAKWSLLPGVELGEGGLGAIAATSKNDAWVVGWSSEPGKGEAQAVTLHWDGKQWNIVPGPSPGEFLNVLRGIAIGPNGEVWAVGSISHSTFVLRYDSATCTTPTINPNP